MQMQEDKQFYQNRLSLCEHDGWRDLVAELKNLETTINSLDSVEDLQDLHFNKGQLAVFRQFIYLEEATRAAAEELEYI